jgi:hypothetical protein
MGHGNIKCQYYDEQSSGMQHVLPDVVTRQRVTACAATVTIQGISQPALALDGVGLSLLRT